MKKKHKNSVKRVATLVILFAILITALAGFGIIKVDVRSGSNNLEQQILPNYSTITDSSKFSIINNNTNKSLIMFTSNWCGSCLGIREELKTLALEFTEIQFYIADIENYRSNAKEYNVAITPALITLQSKTFETYQEVRHENLRKIVTDFSQTGL